MYNPETFDSQDTKHEVHSTLNLLDTVKNGPGPGERNIMEFVAEGGVGGLLGAVPQLERIGGAPWLKEVGVKSMVGGALAAGGAALLDRGLEMATGNDRLFKPTGIDSLAIGLAMGAPVNAPLKVALVTTGWLAGRVYNFFHDPNQAESSSMFLYH